jgi:hypothetical protein
MSRPTTSPLGEVVDRISAFTESDDAHLVKVMADAGKVSGNITKEAEEGQRSERSRKSERRERPGSRYQ